MNSVSSVSLNCLAANIAQPIGVERFVRNVVSGIRLGDIKLRCYVRRSVSNSSQLFDSRLFENNTQVGLKRIIVGPTIFRIFIEMLILPFFTFKDDIVLSINNFGPLWGKPSQFRILVIHDVWFMSPEYDGGQLQKLLFSNLMRLQIKYCSQIITVSDFSRREISHFFNVPLSKIKIVSNCMGKNIEARSNTETNNSLLLIGSDRKNKNVIRTISGFCHFKNSCPDSPVKLIVVGKYSESFFNKIRSSFPGHLSDIKLAGYIDNAKLESLYRQCSGVLFLSLYEGFGLPAIEGLLFGKPVLVSQNTACAELLESFAISVDATDIASISEGIEMLITSKVDTLSPEFQIFQNKFMRCNGPADALTSILSGTEQ